MAVILLILKIIGIILLVVLGLLLFLLAIVLFVPVRYRIVGVLQEKDTAISARCSWLLHLISFVFAYRDGEMKYELRILGIRKSLGDSKAEKKAGEEPDDGEQDAAQQSDDATVGKHAETPQPGEPGGVAGNSDRLSGEPESGMQDDGSRKAGEPDGVAGNSDRLSGEPDDGEQDAVQQSENVIRQEELRGEIKTVQSGGETSGEVKPDKASGGETSEEPGGEETGETASRIRIIWNRIKNFVRNIRQKISHIWNTLTHLPEKINSIYDIITNEANRNTLVLVWRELCSLLRHFRFRKIHAALDFSMGEPALTGQVLGGISVCPFIYQYDIRICPDFEAEKMYVRGDFNVQGRIRVIHLAVSVIRLVKEKDVRSAIAQFRK